MDYFSQPRNGGSSARTPGLTPSPGAGPSSTTPGAFPLTPGSQLQPTASRPQAVPNFRERSSSIRLRRAPSHIRRKPVPTSSSASDHGMAEEDEIEANRRRSSSAPQRPPLDMLEGLGLSQQRTAEPMATIQEAPISPPQGVTLVVPAQDVVPGRRASLMPRFLQTGAARRRELQAGTEQIETASGDRIAVVRPGAIGVLPHEYTSGVVDLLDLVDPEISTLSTLTNVQNSLFVPDLGRFVNRRPTYDLSPRDTHDSSSTETSDSDSDDSSEEEKPPAPPTTGPTSSKDEDEIQEARRTRSDSITSVLDESHYAVLPHGVSLEGWSEQEKVELDDHVRHMLHSRRSKFKRGLKGFGKYIRKPLGFLVTLYAFSITVFGLVWVLMLIGWISGGNDERHKYLINVVDNVLVALFAVVGDGLAPFRAVDTYHMAFIAHYTFTTWRLRREKALPELENQNDLPEARVTDGELEAAQLEKGQYSVLSPSQQLRLEHHQAKFSKSHTFYKPHETTTHHAFSVKLLVVIVVLLDMHSLLQISLGAVTWGIDYRKRSQIPTTIILCFSITANIMAGILISVGDKRSRKKEVIEQMSRQSLTEEAMKKVNKHKKERRKKAEAERRKARKLEAEKNEVEEREVEKAESLGSTAVNTKP